MSTILILAALVPFYLVGAFPTGILVAKSYKVDITTQGSGNVGATNVARVIGKKAGIITLFGDVLKGVVGVVIAGLVVDKAWFAAAAGIALVLGHCFSIPPKLKGGKGVATALGVTLALHPWSAAVAVASFAVVFAASRLVSLSSISAALMVPLGGFLFNLQEATTIALATIGLVVVARHKENIRRLIEGREPTFSSKTG
jgi:glycerol-3-phosphate acyltransferase PlsY